MSRVVGLLWRELRAAGKLSRRFHDSVARTAPPALPLERNGMTLHMMRAFTEHVVSVSRSCRAVQPWNQASLHGRSGHNTNGLKQEYHSL